jgi:hypothetical protein
MSVPLMAEPNMVAGRGDDTVVEVTYTADESGRMVPSQGSDDEGLPNQAGCCSFCNEKGLDIVTGFVIFINVVLMGIELDWPWDGYTYVEQAMLCVYILDVALRMRWNGFRNYMCDKNHLIDITIVGASVFEVWILPMTMAVEATLEDHKAKKRGSIVANLTMTLRAFRLVRAFRLIKLVKFAKPLYMILQSMSAAFARVCWVMVLIGVFLYAFSLVFTQLLGRDMLDALPGDDPLLSKLRLRFSTVPRTFFELFRAMCGDVTDLGILISAEMDNAVVPCAYILFQVTTPWLILSIFTAEVVDTTITTSQGMDREEKSMQALHTRTVQRNKISNELFDLFADVPGCHDRNSLELNSLAAFLEEEYNIHRLGEITGLTAFQAINAWEAIEDNGTANMEDYVDGLVLASHQSTEHSILRMEAQIRGMLRNQTAILDALQLPPASDASKRFEEAVDAIPEHGRREVNGIGRQCLDGKLPISGISSIWTEMSDMRAEIHTGLVQLQSSMQAVQADQTSLRRGISTSKEAEQKAVSEVRKMQRELSESSSQIHGALLGIGDVRNDISVFCKQASSSRSPQMLDELCGEVHQLRSEVADLARAEELGVLRSEIAHLAGVDDMDQACTSRPPAAIDALRGEVYQLRTEVADLARTEDVGQQEASASHPPPQMLDELRSEVSQLRSEVAGLARAEDLGQLSSEVAHLSEACTVAQVASVADQASACSSTQIEALFNDLHQLRGEVSSLARAEDIGQLRSEVVDMARADNVVGRYEVSRIPAVPIDELRSDVQQLRSEVVNLLQSEQARGSETNIIQSPQIEELSGAIQQLRSEVSQLASVESIENLTQARSSDTTTIQGSQIEELSGAVQQLRSEVGQLARAESIESLTQAVQLSRGFVEQKNDQVDTDTIWTGFTDLQGAVDGLRADIAALAQTLQTEPAIAVDPPTGADSSEERLTRRRSTPSLSSGRLSKTDGSSRLDRLLGSKADKEPDDRGLDSGRSPQSDDAGMQVGSSNGKGNSSNSPLLERLRKERRDHIAAQNRR